MSMLTQEVRHVQNPALGGILLWRFACGYSKHHKTGDAPLFQLLFLVLPILFHRPTFNILKSTNRPTGLRGFADKFSRHAIGMSDVLLTIQSRAESWKGLSLKSLQLGIRTRLITLSTSSGAVVPLSFASPSGVPQSVKPMLANADKLGEWCADLSLFEIGVILKVAF